MCVLISSTTFVWNIFHSEKKWAKYDQKFVLVFMYSSGYSCPILIKFEVSRQISEKWWNNEISWKSVHLEPSSMRTEVRTDGRTGGQTDRRT